MKRYLISCSHLLRFCWLAVALLLPSGCVDSFDQTLRERVNVVVVDGTITNLNEPQVIRLNRSKSDSLTGRFGTLPLTGLTVEIVVDSAQAVVLREINTGEYQAPDGFRGQVGHSYQLRFTLRDGTRYQSNQEVMPAVPPIDNVSARFNPTSLPAELYDGTINQYRGAHEVSVSWQDPVGEHNYYRWDWKLYEKQEWCKTCVQGFYEQYNPYDYKTLYEDCYAPAEYQMLNYNYGGYTYYFVNDYTCRTDCWAILSNTDLNVFDDQYSNGGHINGRSVARIPYYQRNGCLIEVRQSSLTQKAYAYFKLFQAQTQNTGGLADTPPTALAGNVRNVTNSRERVVGYFTASAVSSSRYWIDRKDATGQPPGLFVALNGRLPSREGEIDPNTGKGKPTAPFNILQKRVLTAICSPSDSQTPYKPDGWRD